MSSRIDSWLVLEARFRELAGDLRYLRLDHQWGAAGVYWHLAGLGESPAQRQFVALVAIGSIELEKAIPQESDIGRLLAQEEPKYKWFRALKELSGAFNSQLPGEQCDEAGNSMGHIFSGSIEQVAYESANLCLTLETHFPMKDDTPFLQKLWRDHSHEIVIGVILAGVAAILGAFFG